MKLRHWAAYFAWDSAPLGRTLDEAPAWGAGRVLQRCDITNQNGNLFYELLGKIGRKKTQMAEAK